MKLRLILLPLIVLSLIAVTALARTWTSKDGNYKVEAEFIEYKDAKVHLKKADGTIIAISPFKLSTADRKWLSEELNRRRNDKSSKPDSKKGAPEKEPLVLDYALGLNQQAKGMAWSPDSKQLAVSDNQSVKIWDTTSWKLLATLQPQQGTKLTGYLA